MVTKQEFFNDIKTNYDAMESFGISKNDAKYFLPPFEWYNDDISSWCMEIGLTLVDFTPGTSSNQD